MICQKCRQPLPEGVKFCPECGHRQPLQINCIACGQILPEGVKFCPECGTRVGETPAPVAPETVSETPETVVETPAEAEETPAAEQTPVEEQSPAAPVQAENTARKSKKKKIIIIAAIAVLVLAIVAVALFFLLRDTTSKSQAFAFVDDDGNACLIYDNGKKLEFGPNVESAYMTADRKTVVVITKDNQLYWSDDQHSEKHTILEANADRRLSLYGIYDDYVIYMTRDDAGSAFYAYEFDQEETTILIANNESADLIKSTDQVTAEAAILFAVGGQIKVWSSEYDTPAAYESYGVDNEVQLLSVDPEGTTFVWAEIAGETCTVYAHIDHQQKTLFTTVATDDLAAGVSVDGKMIVAYARSIEGSKLAYLKKGEVKTVEVEGAIHGLGSLSGQNFLADSACARDDGLFLSSAKTLGGTQTLYYLDYESGSLSALCLDMKQSVLVSAERLVYINDEDELIYAEINAKGGNLVNRTKIDSNISADHVVLSQKKSNYIYYVSDVNAEATEGELHVFDIGSKSEKTKIDNVYPGNLFVSTDGKTVYYFFGAGTSNTTRPKTIGTLQYYNAAKGRGNVIASGVVTDWLTSYLVTNEIKPNSFFYYKWEGYEQGFAFYYYNGKESTMFYQSE